MANCVRNDIEQIFGLLSVAEWAKLDATDSTAMQTARITLACAIGSERVDNVLRGTPYRVPCLNSAGTVPLTIIDLSAHFAGLWLYTSRGVEDMEFRDGKPVHRLSSHQALAEMDLEAIRSGRWVLDAQRGG